MSYSISTNPKTKEQLEDEFQQLHLSLPKDEWFGYPMCLHQSFWCLDDGNFEGLVAFQSQFQAHDTDIILASLPKTGTTWLKSLLFTIINRKDLSHISCHTLNSTNPHELVPHLEIKIYNKFEPPNLTDLPSPRLFGTHLPYLSLPSSIKSSKCKIVYICRNPLDNFVSLCHFFLQFDMNKKAMLDVDMMEEHLDKYCKGVFPFGPYDDHLLGYWKESMQNSNKVLFLEYEGLKKEPKSHLKMLAEFINCPFSEEEEKGNVVDEIIELCSLKSLKEMEVNKSGKFYPWFENKALFRKGEIGDWTNYLTISMAKRINEIQGKLKMVGFSSSYYQTNL